MAKPENAKQLPVASDLTYTALECAADLIPAARRYRLVVHPHRLAEAARVVNYHADVDDNNALAPSVELIADDLIIDVNEWRLETVAGCVWSPGA